MCIHIIIFTNASSKFREGSMKGHRIFIKNNRTEVFHNIVWKSEERRNQQRKFWLCFFRNTVISKWGDDWISWTSFGEISFQLNPLFVQDDSYLDQYSQNMN